MNISSAYKAIKLVRMTGRFLDGLMPDGNAVEAQELANKGVLDCLPSFRTASKEHLFDICNGCGSGWNEKIIPDNFWFLYIGHCCFEHDYSYEKGITPEDRKDADDRMLRNLYEIIELDTAWWRSNWKMRRMAKGAWWIARKRGKSAFYQKKYTENQIAFNKANNLPADFNIDGTIPKP